MDNIKIIIPHEGVNEIPKGYKPLFTNDGKFIAIIAEGLNKEDLYWLEINNVVPVMNSEQRRYELAKAAMQGYCSGKIGEMDYDKVAEIAVKQADALINALGSNDNDLLKKRKNDNRRGV